MRVTSGDSTQAYEVQERELHTNEALRRKTVCGFGQDNSQSLYYITASVVDLRMIAGGLK